MIFSENRFPFFRIMLWNRTTTEERAVQISGRFDAVTGSS